MGGRVAAELTVRAFLEGYYSLPDTLGIETLAARSLAAINSWIHAQGRQDPQLNGMATTFTAAILRGRALHIVHVGDSRVYRLRTQHCEILTDDHTLKQPDLHHVLYRAVGLEQQVRADHQVLDTQAGDRLLLCTDGIYSVLRTNTLKTLLASGAEPQVLADRIVATALQQGSQDNVTALVIDIQSVPATDRRQLEAVLDTLPLRDPPKPGTEIDGFRLIRTISEGRYSRLILAESTQASTSEKSSRPVVLKFPQPQVASELDYRRAFVREALIGTRVHSPWVAEILSLPAERQSCLYSVMPFYHGQTLGTYIDRHQPIDLTTGCTIALKLCKAVYALHRQRIIHRDIKPDNVFLLDDMGLKLLDLGVARLPGWEEEQPEDQPDPIPGTASFMAPEQFSGERGAIATDVYALGVTLFFMFTRTYPYGEIEPFTHPRFVKRKLLSELRPDLPLWLGRLLDKTLSSRPDERPQDSMELAFELEQGMNGGAQGLPAPKSLLQSNPLLFWQSLSFLLSAALLIMIWLHAHP